MSGLLQAAMACLLMVTMEMMMVSAVDVGMMSKQNLAHSTDIHLLFDNQNDVADHRMEEGNHIEHTNLKFFHNMVNRNHELTAVESFNVDSNFDTTTTISDEDFASTTSDTISQDGGKPTESATESNIDEDNSSADFTAEAEILGSFETQRPNHKHNTVTQLIKAGEEAMSESKNMTEAEPKPINTKTTLSRILTSEDRSTENQGQVPQRREKKSIRQIAVPISIFHYLGFLPIKIPGIPFHNELPSPDYAPYLPYNTIEIPDKRKRRGWFF